MSKDTDTVPQTAPLAPWGSAERGGQQPWPVTPDEQAQHAAYWNVQEASAKARAAEIAAAIRQQPVQGKCKGWGE